MSPLKDHWLPLSMRGLQVWNGFIVQLTTDVPCHIWLRWTTNPPHIHKKIARRRGIALYDDLYYCFTTYGDIEQNQPGDTTRHTFHFAKLIDGLEYWFYHWGYIGGARSKSCSPILPIRHQPANLVLNPDFTAWTPFPADPSFELPDHWTRYYSGGGIGNYLKDGTDYWNSPYSLDIRSKGYSFSVGLKQNISAELWRGATAILKAYGYTARQDFETFIAILQDGTAPGSARALLPLAPWSQVEATISIPEDANFLEFRCQIHDDDNRWEYAHLDAFTLEIPEPIPA